MRWIFPETDPRLLGRFVQVGEAKPVLVPLVEAHAAGPSSVRR